MTTTLFLLRHAAHDDVGCYLAGRLHGVHLGLAGRAQALRLGERMRRERFDAIASSPRERTRETAQAISSTCEIGPVTIQGELDEIDFGAWSGKTFTELDEDPAWRRWNSERAIAVTPAGESMQRVQERIHGCMQELSRKFSGGGVVLVSHADVIKCAICKVLGLPADRCFRFDIDPASISIVVMGDWGAKVLRLNESV
jgi:probable phosphoglycerate mutase